MVKHIYAGECPDSLIGPTTSRNPECPGCAELDALCAVDSALSHEVVLDSFELARIAVQRLSRIAELELVLKQAREAMQWDVGGEPLPTLEVEAIAAIDKVLATDRQPPADQNGRAAWQERRADEIEAKMKADMGTQERVKCASCGLVHLRANRELLDAEGDGMLLSTCPECGAASFYAMVDQ